MKAYSNVKLAFRRLGICASTIILLAFASPTMAQDSAEESNSQIEVMVVTATKRARTLQDTPIAVSVVSNVDIEKAEVKDIFDLQSTVPALRVSQGASTANSGFSIRGFGGVASNAGIEPSVGVFVDGVYRSRASSAISDLLNVERVEVLRGPQSTLFGKNASVGVVSLISKEPEFEPEQELSVTLGNYSTLRTSANITGPISDSFAYRIAASYNQRDGYATNLETGGDLNNRDRYAVQGQILFSPDDDLKIKLIADFDEINESCCLTSNVFSGPITDFVVGALGQFVDEDPFSYNQYANFDPINDIKNGGVSFHIDKNFGFADFTSITAYRTGESFTFTDADATSAEIATSENTGEIDTFTQEFRLASTDSDSPVSWLVGASYFDESIEFPGVFLYGADFRAFVDGAFGGAITAVETALGVTPGTFGQEGQGPTEERGQDNTSWSVFGNFDVNLTDNLTGTLGLSYIDDTKDAFLSQVNTDAFSALDFVAIGFAQGLIAAGVNPNDPVAIAAFAAANPAAFATIQSEAQSAATNPLIALKDLQFNPPFLDFPNSVEDGRSADDKFTYTVRLAYDMSDEISLYGSYSTGFKATSWNLSRNSRPFASDFIPGSPVTSPPSSPIRDAGLAVPNLENGTRFAGPEDTTVIEAGLKMQTNNLSLNVAVFDQTVEGFQSNTFVGAGFELANAGEQSTRGIELDTRWAVNDALTLSFSGAFYDPKFDEFIDSPDGDLSGRTPAGIPRVATSAGLDYDFQMFGYDSFLRTDWQYSGPRDYFNNAVRQQTIGIRNESHLVNASVGILFSEDTTATLWGRNIFGEEFLLGAAPSLAQGASISGTPNQPATYGITIRQQF